MSFNIEIVNTYIQYKTIPILKIGTCILFFIIFPKLKNTTDEELYTIFPDGSRMIGGPGMIAVKEKGYKSVEDYEKRSHEEWLKKQEQNKK